MFERNFNVESCKLQLYSVLLQVACICICIPPNCMAVLSHLIKSTLNNFAAKKEKKDYLMMFSYSLSLPRLSFHLRYITDASTFAGLEVFGSFNKLTCGELI